MLLTGGGIGHSNQSHPPRSASASDISSVEPLEASIEVDGDDSDEDTPLEGDDTEPDSNAGDSEIQSDDDLMAEEDEYESEGDDVNLSDDGYGSA
jgi:hypothetical protein